MKRIRGGGGLGDALYVRSVVEYLLRKGTNLEVCTNYPTLFSDLPVRVSDFARSSIDVLAHYSARKTKPTNQWQDICLQAGITESIPQRITWSPKNYELLKKITWVASGRRVVLVASPHVPMARKDDFGKEILPGQDVFNKVLSQMSGCYRVLVGSEKPLYEVEADLDLTGVTSPTDLLDLASLADGLIGQCSYIIPLAESFHKPLLCIWSSTAKHSRHEYVRQITPEKILSSEQSSYVFDDWSFAHISERVDDFMFRGMGISNGAAACAS